MNPKMKTKLEILFQIIFMIFLFDFICFIVWIAVGQTPPDGFYFGMITGNLLKVLLMNIIK